MPHERLTMNKNQKDQPMLSPHPLTCDPTLRSIRPTQLLEARECALQGAGRPKAAACQSRKTNDVWSTAEATPGK
jgi:hypothetical protein